MGGAQPHGTTAIDGSAQLALSLAAASADGAEAPGAKELPGAREQLTPSAASPASLAAAGLGLACCAACTVAGGLSLARRCRAPPRITASITTTNAARRRRRAPRELAAASTPAQELAAKAARAARVVGAARTPQGQTPQGRMPQGPQAGAQGRYVRVAVACERQPSVSEISSL